MGSLCAACFFSFCVCVCVCVLCAGGAGIGPAWFGAPGGVCVPWGS